MKRLCPACAAPLQTWKFLAGVGEFACGRCGTASVLNLTPARIALLAAGAWLFVAGIAGLVAQGLGGTRLFWLYAVMLVAGLIGLRASAPIVQATALNADLQRKRQWLAIALVILPLLLMGGLMRALTAGS